MTRPTVNATAETINAYLGEGITRPDADHDWTLLRLLDGITGPLEEVAAVGRARDGRPGWAVVLDPDTCPADALPWLAQWVGVDFPDNATESQKRALIKDRPQARRGTVDFLLAAAIAGTADPDVADAVMRERSIWPHPSGDEPLWFRIRLFDVDTVLPTWANLPDGLTAATLPSPITWSSLSREGIAAARAVAAGKPAGLRFVVVVEPGPACDETLWETLDDVPDDLTLDDLVLLGPEES